MASEISVEISAGSTQQSQLDDDLPFHNGLNGLRRDVPKIRLSHPSSKLPNIHDSYVHVTQSSALDRSRMYTQHIQTPKLITDFAFRTFHRAFVSL